MCSILAIASENKLSPAVIDSTSEALKVSRARGPDAQGLIQIHENVILASNRLSIVDTSEAGNMPISDKSGRYHIVFNGEIYNFKELKKLLKNVELQSQSDTEVLLNLLIQKGIDAIRLLDGMFAFFFIDSLTGNIIIARDRLGIKPLYYGLVNAALVVTSDVRTFIKIPGFRKSISYEGLTSFIKFRFIPAPHSIFEGVSKLMPGHYINTSIHRLALKPELYWEPRYEHNQISLPEAAEKLAQLTENAVIKSSMGDVPTAVLLSGGIDSSAVYDFMKRNNIKTQPFTCQYKSKKNTNNTDVMDGTSLIYQDQTEAQFAQLMADRYGDTLNTITLDLTNIVEDFDDMIWSMGEPMASTDAIGHYLLAKNIPKQFKVLMTGTGADELLGGYTYLFLDGGAFIKGDVQAVDFLNKFSNPFDPSQDVTAILSDEYRKKDSIEDMVIKQVNKFPISRYPEEKINYHMFFELLFDLPGWELDQGDRMYMAFSKETRPAFLQNDFVDFALQLPSAYKFHNNNEKFIFKKALEPFLPAAITERRKHPSLGTPHSVFKTQWFKERIDRARKNQFGIFSQKLPASVKSQLKADPDLQYRMIVLDSWLRKVYM